MVSHANPFETPGSFYKGNLHTHTTNSDGALSPSEIVAMYRDEGGYDFLAISDHGTLTPTDGLPSDGFALLPAAEMHRGANEIGHAHHILCVGVGPTVTKLDEKAGAQDVIDATNADGGLCFLAHPYWHGCTWVDLAGLRGYAGIEVFNSTCQVGIGKGSSAIVWDDLLARGKRLVGIAVDDAHCHATDWFGGWVMVKAPELSVSAILEAIRSGCFYASSGPEIRNVAFADGRVVVDCSPVRAIDIVSSGPCGHSFRDPDGGLMEHLESQVTNISGYIRVQVTDAEGRSAWTNPLYLAEDGTPA